MQGICAKEFECWIDGHNDAEDPICVTAFDPQMAASDAAKNVDRAEPGEIDFIDGDVSVFVREKGVGEYQEFAINAWYETHYLAVPVRK